MRIAHYLFAAWLLLSLAPQAEAITYDIGTINLSGGYTATGTITTNGTLGTLTPSDVTMWAVDVTGPQPFMFSHTSGSISLFSQLSATSTTLSTSTFFTFRDDVSINPNCGGSGCQQYFSWEDSGDEISYLYWDSEDEDPLFSGSVANASTPLVIATVSQAPLAVPEPSTLTLAALGFLALIRRRRRK